MVIKAVQRRNTRPTKTADVIYLGATTLDEPFRTVIVAVDADTRSVLGTYDVPAYDVVGENISSDDTGIFNARVFEDTAYFLTKARITTDTSSESGTISDTFNRSNSSDPGNCDGGSIFGTFSWQERNGSQWGITGNKMYCISDGTNGWSAVAIDSGLPGGFIVEALINGPPSFFGTEAGIFGNLRTDQTAVGGWYVRADGTHYFWDPNGNLANTGASYKKELPGNIIAPTVMKMRYNAGLYTFYLNGVEIDDFSPGFSTPSSTIVGLTGTFVGLDNVWDSFQYTRLVTGGASQDFWDAPIYDSWRILSFEDDPDLSSPHYVILENSDSGASNGSLLSSDVLEVDESHAYTQQRLSDNPQSYSQEVERDRPRVWLRLGENSPSQPAVDASGHGHDGSYTGSVELGLFGSSLVEDNDSSATLDAYSEHVSSGQVTEDFEEYPDGAAIEVVLQVNDIALLNGSVVMFGDPTAPSPPENAQFSYIALFTSTMGIYAGSTQNLHIAGPHTFTTGQRYHIVGRYNPDSGLTELWVNGVLIDTGSGAGPWNAAPGSSLHVQPQTSGSGHFDITFDEAAFYDHDLPAGRIERHAAAAGLLGAPSSEYTVGTAKYKKSSGTKLVEYPSDSENGETQPWLWAFAPDLQHIYAVSTRTQGADHAVLYGTINDWNDGATTSDSHEFYRPSFDYTSATNTPDFLTGQFRIQQLAVDKDTGNIFMQGYGEDDEDGNAVIEECNPDGQFVRMYKPQVNEFTFSWDASFIKAMAVVGKSLLVVGNLGHINGDTNTYYEDVLWIIDTRTGQGENGPVYRPSPEVGQSMFIVDLDATAKPIIQNATAGPKVGSIVQRGT